MIYVYFRMDIRPQAKLYVKTVPLWKKIQHFLLLYQKFVNIFMAIGVVNIFILFISK